MRDASGDENDSRTASVGLQRPHSNGSNGASRQSSRDRKIGKKQARGKGRVGRSDFRDFVPQGGTFSAAALDVDPDSADSTSTSSSGSSSSSSDESEEEQEQPSEGQKPLGSVPVAINWNKGSRSTIRTSLTGKTSRPDGNATTTAFESVNGKYWRSRSASVSSEDSHGHTEAKRDPSEDGRTDGDRVKAVQRPYFIDDSEGSETGEVSEGGDSIMLNLGPGNDEAGVDKAGDDTPPAGADPFRIDTQPDPGFVSANGSAGDHSVIRSKEDAFRVLSEKYSTPPSILADLNRKDLEIQARHFFYNRSIHDIDLSQPIACTECLQEGHLAIVCPTKEVCSFLFFFLARMRIGG